MTIPVRSFVSLSVLYVSDTLPVVEEGYNFYMTPPPSGRRDVRVGRKSEFHSTFHFTWVSE